MRFRLLLLAAAISLAAYPQSLPQVHGLVEDALGRPVAGAQVVLRNGQGAILARTESDAQGLYEFAELPAAAVRLEASRAGLAPAGESAGAHPTPLVLGLAPVETSVNVSATGLSLPAAQVGNATASISAAQLQDLHPLQAAAALRLQPGLGVIRSGQPGAVTTVFMRGAPADFTKVLLNGVPIQRIDLGGYDFSTLAPVGIQEMQILRGPDSVVYGSDAAAGVISIRSRRGNDVAAPELDSTTQLGSYSTLTQSNQLLGSHGGFDYALRYGYLDTNNQIPGSKFRDNTYGASLGWRLATPWSRQPAQVRLELQRIYSDTGEPNALLFYGLSQGAFKRQGETYSSVSYSQQMAPRWRQTLRYTDARSNLMDEAPAPVGVPDGFGDYDGLPVTIRGANGTSAQGQAVLSFAGKFPQRSPSDTWRRDFDWTSEFTVRPQWSLIEGYRYYDERGLSSNVALRRHDHGVYVVLNGGLWNRVFVNGGLSLDDNTPFGTSSNPQASLAWYPHLGGGFWGATRLRASTGRGWKEPALEVEEFSLYQELLGAPGGAALIQQFGLRPVRPERSRNLDFGLDQDLAHGRVRVGATLFDQRYYDLLEDIPASAFPALGIPSAVAQVAQFGGEYNSLDERARGLELEAQARLNAYWSLRGSYTATAAKVVRSYSFDALAPTLNPNYPGIAIGAFAPLVGMRPFRVPPQTGSFEALFARSRFTGTASAYFVSRRDDSTFLTDANFGNTLLLPNRNLDPAFGILDLSAGWRLSPRWQLLAAVDNALDHAYQEVIGFPGPKASARLGIRFRWSPRRP